VVSAKFKEEFERANKDKESKNKKKKKKTLMDFDNLDEKEKEILKAA
jgi:hypothetical protein